jgi:hypothetical protein
VESPNPFAAPSTDPTKLDDDDPYRLALDLQFAQTRKLLIAIAVLYTLGGAFSFFISSGVEAIGVLVIHGFLAATHVALWIWAKSSPYGAIVTAIVLFFGLHGVNFLVDPASILQGIIVKVVIAIALIRGYRIAQQIRQYAASQAR